MSYIIYHNNRCRKSREVLAILQETGVELEVIEYLKTPLSKPQITELLAKLGLSADQVFRKNEAVYKTHVKGKNLSEGALIELWVEHQILMERPIVEHRNRALICRPPELVKDLL